MMARRKKKAMLKTLKKSLHSITSDWTKAKRQADRQNRVSRADLDRMRRGYYRVTVKDAAYEVMEQSYLKASSNGALPETLGRSCMQRVRWSWRKPAESAGRTHHTSHRCCSRISWRKILKSPASGTWFTMRAGI